MTGWQPSESGWVSSVEDGLRKYRGAKSDSPCELSFQGQEDLGAWMACCGINSRQVTTGGASLKGSILPRGKERRVVRVWVGVEEEGLI